MTIDKLRDEKLQYDIDREKEKYQHYYQVKLINTNILLVKKYYLLNKVKLKNKVSFEKQIKMIEMQLKNKQTKSLQNLQTIKQ